MKRGITADWTALFKEGFLANKIAGGAADRCKKPSAFWASFFVPGNLCIAVLAKKPGFTRICH